MSVSCIGNEPLGLDMGDGQMGDTAVVIRLRRKEQKLDEVEVSATFTSYRNTSGCKTESRAPFTGKISSTGFDIKGALREIALKSHAEVTLGPGKLRAGPR